MLKGQHILIGITGGIAAYKIPQLVRLFKQAGAEVRVVMTEAATYFTTPVTLSTLTEDEVYQSIFPSKKDNPTNLQTWHVELGMWADIMLIVPATANSIAKLSYGIADNAVTTLALALRCPLVLSPAMDMDMWNNPVTQDNITKLQERGCFIIPPESGELASGLQGPGRLPDLQAIKKTIDRILNTTHRDLSKIKILITAGPTIEPIDHVRYISNHSSGKMGFAIANAAAQRGAEVTLISGPVNLQSPRNTKRINVETALQMYQAVMKHYKKMDVVIMSAAVADFTPSNKVDGKIKKDNIHNNELSISLKKTKDILQTLGTLKKDFILVGFALETANEIRNAKQKLKEKNLDLIVVNNPLHKGAGFNVDTNIVTIITKSGKIAKLKKMSKFHVANEILDRITTILK